MEEKYYIVFKDYSMGYINYLCECNQCQERGALEFTLHSLNGEWLDSCTAEELVDKSLAISNDIQDIVNELKNNFERKINILNLTIRAKDSIIRLGKKNDE